MASVAAKGRTFSLLEREYYISQKIFDLEYDRIYSSDWIYAGHVSQFPAKGDYLICEYAKEEIVVVRGEGDQFFAHLNVCRHRGYRLCHEKRGHVSSFVCGYHQWRFALDGSLKTVPKMRDGEYFNYSEFPLRMAHVEVWNGLIFVNLGKGHVAPIRERLQSFEPMISRFAPKETKLAHEKIYPIAANWKVVIENALECYHCFATHRSLCSVIDVSGLMTDLKDWLGDSRGEGTANLGASGMRVKPGMKTMSPDGELICEKLLGNCTSEDAAKGFTGGLMIVPNFFYANFYSDHWWTIAIRPKSAVETDLVYSWFVRHDADEGKDFDLQRLIEVAHNTQTEDNALIERTQRGVASRYFAPGPIGANVEPALYDFAATYMKYMSAAPVSP